jgi:hypothetical protein
MIASFEGDSTLMADEPKYPNVRAFSFIVSPLANVVSSTATATVTFGGEIWRSADLPRQPPPEHPIYSLVGQVASSWAHIDHLLDILIWQLADVEAQAGACITAQIAGTYGRFRAVIALLRFHQERTNRDLKKLIDKATELSNKANIPGEERHRSIHDPWYEYPYTADQTAQFRAMPHKDPRYGIEPVDLEKIKADLEDIKKFSDRVKAFRDDVLATLVTSF